MLKILFATPCYGAQVYDCYLHSLFDLQKKCLKHGVELELFTVPNDALVQRARNICVAKFLDGDYTHMLFCDADTGFTPDNVFHLLEYNKDVCCGACPVKNIFWEDAMQAETPEMAKRMSLRYVVNAVNNKHENGFVEIKDGGTGFMLIKRTVFEQMREAYPELNYKSPNYPSDNLYLFFDCFKEGDAYLSEDYGFCRRWEKLGGKIYMDFKHPLIHAGINLFGG